MVFSTEDVKALDYALLEKIKSPSDLKTLNTAQLNKLATQIREFLISKVSKTGGHLGPNLGVVELTLAVHRQFNSPYNPILFDTGHQSYVHKLITGRQNGFDNLRQKNGLSGYPSRNESVHDVIESSHASSALSWADGIARAHVLNGESNRHVVAIVGDGALTGGMSWEALNNIAATSNLPVIIVVNDNARSYSPTIGGVATYLQTLRTTQGYENFLKLVKNVLEKTPVVGNPIYETLYGFKKGIRDFVAPQGMFEDIGLKYIGPVDGHNIDELERALIQAKKYGGPVIVHAITEKGRGHQPAVNDMAEKFHAVGVISPITGVAINKPATTWTSTFGKTLVEIAENNPKVVAITAAMLGPTGLNEFQNRFPTRIFDVGIAEQHAVTSAAGMAYAGLHPVVAIYSTFLNRAYDQLMMDVALHKAPVTFVLDRAGVTGDDGASHNGVWDLALTGTIPGLRVAAPRDATRLKELLAEAVADNNGPTLIRFPKGSIGDDVPAFDSKNGLDILYRGDGADVLLISIGTFAKICVEAAAHAYKEGVGVTVVDPRWV